MTDSGQDQTKSRMSPWIFWTGWAFIIIVGTSVSDTMLDYTIGPPYAITTLLSYPFYVQGFLLSVRKSLFAALIPTILYLWYLVFALGCFEALVVMPWIGIALLLLVVVLCFFIPISLAVWKKPSQTASQPYGRGLRVAFAVIFFVLILLTPLDTIGSLISATEFVQANAFRDFCSSKIEGLSLNEIQEAVPTRFIRPASGKLEISSHGRGCVITLDGDQAHVERLMPATGFPWMISGIPGAQLKGAFE